MKYGHKQTWCGRIVVYRWGGMCLGGCGGMLGRGYFVMGG